MRFEDKNWMQVEDYLKKEDRVMLVLGACEQHGYLSLLTDIRIPLALASAASEKTGVLVAPSLNFGISPYFLKYPGTIALRQETLLGVMEDIIRSLYGQGFRRFLILNGHGGNDGAATFLFELANQLDGLKTSWYDWWTSKTVRDFAQKHNLLTEHASWMEAFPFTRVAELPEGVKMSLNLPSWLLNAAQMREHAGDGVYGGAYKTDIAMMDELFQLCLADVVKQLSFE